MFCWCLNLWQSTNNGYSQLLFIYQITPDSFTIDKSPQFMMMSYVLRTMWKNKKIPSRHRRGMGDIILDYMDFFSLPAPKSIERKFINVPEGWSEREKKRDRKIKLTVFIMWLCSLKSKAFIQKVTFWGNEGKVFLSSFFFPFSSVQWSNHSEIILLIFRSFCAPIILRVIYINQ